MNDSVIVRNSPISVMAPQIPQAASSIFPITESAKEDVVAKISAYVVGIGARCQNATRHGLMTSRIDGWAVFMTRHKARPAIDV